MKSTADIMERIRRLLALSKSPNEHEAASAAAAAAAMMDEHKLDQAEIELAGGDPELEAVEDTILYGDFMERKTWKIVIVQGVCILNECKPYITPRNVRIVGRTSSIQTVDYTVKYLWNAAKEICDREYRSVRLRPQSQQVWKSSFLAGCANRLYARLNELHAAKNPTDCQALVLVRKHDQEVADVFDRLNTHDANLKRQKVSTTAYRAGTAAANTIGLVGDHKSLAPESLRIKGA